MVSLNLKSLLLLVFAGVIALVLLRFVFWLLESLLLLVFAGVIALVLLRFVLWLLKIVVFLVIVYLVYDLLKRVF
ncbi:MAG: hypothetical protein ACXQTM_02360 [Methanosarcinales archaeon]